MVYKESFLRGGNTTDEFGHGTHIAGIIAGDGDASSGDGSFFTLKGVAPGVSLINLRVLDANGQGTDSAVIAAIDRAIQLKSRYNIRVINLSLGRPVFESYTRDPLCQAVERAWKAGIVVVVAAGNQGRNNAAGTNGYGTIQSPANDPYVITVGAMKTFDTESRADDRIATYSSKGPTLFDHVVKPDLVAAGNWIASTIHAPSSTTLGKQSPGNVVPLSEYTRGNSGESDRYMWLSGTSMAAPMVSAAAALLLERTPTLNPDQVKARLMKRDRKSTRLNSSHT